jgi:hypothetical protein
MATTGVAKGISSEMVNATGVARAIASEMVNATGIIYR